MMNRRTLHRALFLACIALLFFVGLGTRVQAERLYILDNIMVNGDFLKDTDADGRADEWTITGTGVSFYISSGVQYIKKNTDTATIQLFQYLPVPQSATHIFYLSYDVYTNVSYGANRWYNRVSPYGSIALQLNLTQKHYSFIFSNTTYTSVEINFQLGSGGSIGDYIGLDNVILIDLTKTFGSGFEPSLSDFESYYLPSADSYFDEYSTLDPSTYIQLDSTNYPNLLGDLTGLDYSKSIMDNYGNNVTMDVFAYVYNTGPVSWAYDVSHYVDTEHPILEFMGKTYTLSWEVSDYSAYVIHLVMSDEENEILKKILFNRNIDTDNEYFTFDISATAASYTKLWFQISNTFRLNVDIESILLSREVVTENDFNMVNTMYYKFYDRYGNILLPALKIVIGAMYETRLVNDFGSQYTDISEFAIEIEVASPYSNDPYTVESHYFYELGIFSSSDIVFAIPGDTDIDHLWEYQTCTWYDLPCQVSNSLNNLLTDIYNGIHMGEIIGFFQDIFAYIALIGAMMPNGAQIAIITILISGLTGAVILIIVDRL